MKQKQSQREFIPKYLADRIRFLQNQEPLEYTLTLFQRCQDRKRYVLDFYLNEQRNPQMPLFLQSQYSLSETTLTISIHNKQKILAQNFEIVGCDEINALLSNYIVLNVQISGIVGCRYELAGFTYQQKTVVSFDSLCQKSLKQVSQLNRICQEEYLKGLITKKMKKQQQICYMVRPIVQLQTEAVLICRNNEFEQQILITGEDLYRQVSVIIQQQATDKDLQQLSALTHQAILQSLENQSYLSIASFRYLSNNCRFNPKKIFNPHAYIKPEQKDKYEFITVKGSYEYYHYGDQNFNDNGWGCAYRAFQTLFSWLHIKGYTKPMSSMMTLRQIQQQIDHIDRTRKLKGSSEWIGANEIAWLVSRKTQPEINCKILHLSDGKKIMDRCEELKNHFLKIGSPIMYGGGQYAYSIVGMYYSWKLGECEFLILDPHYTGEDDYDKIIEKKGLSWRKPEEMFKKGTFYNLCLPLIE